MLSTRTLCRVLYSYLVAFNGAVSSQKLNKPPFGFPGAFRADVFVISAGPFVYRSFEPI